MKYDLQTPSPLRQMIDLLGSQFDPETKQIDLQMVTQACKNIHMAAANKSEPLPDDVFAPGINEHITRLALTGLATTVYQIVQQFAARKIQQANNRQPNG